MPGPSYRTLRMINKYPPAKLEVLRLLAPQRGLTAIAKSKSKTEKTMNGRLPELSNFESPRQSREFTMIKLCQSCKGGVAHSRDRTRL